MNFRITRAIAAAATSVALLTAAGCGGSSQADTAKKNLAADFAKSSGSFHATKGQANCVAGTMVDKIGVDNLKKYGILTQDLKANHNLQNVKMSAKDADSASHALVDCIDTVKLIEDQMGSSGSLPASAKACVQKNLTKDTVQKAFSFFFQGKSTEGSQVMQKSMAKCMKA